MYRYAALFVMALGAVVGEPFDLTKEESEALETYMIPIFAKCSEEFNVKPNDMSQSNMNKLLDPCYLACCLKETNLIDEKGMFDKEKGFELSKSIVKTDMTMEKIKEIIGNCATVNDENVSDGEKGCDRAQLLMGCVKSELGI